MVAYVVCRQPVFDGEIPHCQAYGIARVSLQGTVLYGKHFVEKLWYVETQCTPLVFLPFADLGVPSAVGEGKL